ncbi:MAG: hypothetical protein HY695_06160 [Deltaproteobacteria bacterium]|nr:hypothetical protein [Deltaproteobacteria bacterium]
MRAKESKPLKRGWLKAPVIVVFGTLLTLHAVFTEDLYCQAPFYQGKTVTVIRGGPAGDTGDLRVRPVLAYLRKYIPGNPTIITEYMPGAGGRKAANHLYRAARPDGLTIANVGGGFLSSAILSEPGVQYDVDKFIYLGSPNSATHYVFVTRKEAHLSTVEKLRGASGIRIGAQAVGHAVYNAGRIFAWLLGLRDPKFVTGYAGQEIDLALVKGEVDARANIADTIVQRMPEWLDKGLVDLHSIIEIPKGDKHPRFAHLPELDAFTRSDIERNLLALFRAFRLAGSPYLLPPGTPADRVQILQYAMRNTFRDPDFHKEFKKLTGDDPTPLLPEAQERSIRELPRDPTVIELFKKLTGTGPLPVR